MRRLLQIFALLVCSGCALTLADVADRFEGKLNPCKVEGVERTVLCGDLEVWEDRVGQTGRKIPIHVAVLPALNPDPSPDPVFFFEGGPGEPGTRAVKEMGGLLGGLTDTRDLVFFDQRGTGKSNALFCELPSTEQGVDDYFDDLFPAANLKACLPGLQQKADLRLYTTALAMDDVDDVRAWLGYDRINLYGISYGSRAAQVYLRQHGKHVRSVVLMGVVPMDDKMPLPFARFAQVSLDRVLDECLSDTACRGAFPDIRQDLQKTLSALDRAPAHASIAVEGSKKQLDVTMTRSVFSAALRNMLYGAGGYINIPLYVHAAAQGDFTLMANEAYEYGKGRENWSIGMYLSITCAEDVAGIDMKDVPAAIEGTFLNDDRIVQQVRACSFWPRAQIPKGYGQPVESIAPVLLLSGWMDPATPPEQAASVAKGYPNSLHIIAQDASHGPFGLENESCEWRILQDFVREGTPYNLDTSCLREMHHKPFRLK